MVGSQHARAPSHHRSQSAHSAARRRAAAAAQQQQQQCPMPLSPGPSSLGFPVLLVPAFALGGCVAVAVQLLWGGLTLTSFFLKLFFYISFALLCFLAGSFVLLTRKSPLKVSRFTRHTRQSCVRFDFFSKLMGRFVVPVPEPSQSRRVVVSHNVDKALKEVFDLAYRDYILSWYVPLSQDEGQLYSMLSDDWWQMMAQLRSRLAHIDVVNVVCYDSIRILHTHFTDLKAASARYRLEPDRYIGWSILSADMSTWKHIVYRPICLLIWADISHGHVIPRYKS
ncbi:hypothetical protein NL108_018471 [Boleophthalmus pectinirostris]|nr:hypothetical protein NL108_018471 [Boleophthalmus pectinirostris]